MEHSTLNPSNISKAFEGQTQTLSEDNDEEETRPDKK
jgi:hypothetical protein